MNICRTEYGHRWTAGLLACLLLQRTLTDRAVGVLWLPGLRGRCFRDCWVGMASGRASGTSLCHREIHAAGDLGIGMRYCS